MQGVTKRRLVILLLVMGLLATACTEESRDKIREALPSGVSGLPTALPSPGLSDGPTGSQPGEPTGSTGGEPEESTGPTGSVEAPTEEPVEPATETPTAEPTQGPAPGQGALILAIIGILERFGEEAPPGEQPSPTETTSPEPTGPGGEPEGETPAGPTGQPTGVTSVVAGPTGATDTAGSGEGDASEAVVQAAVSSTTETSTWVLLVFLAVLGGVLWYLWWRARRGRAHHG